MYLSHHSLRVNCLRSATEFYGNRVGLKCTKIKRTTRKTETLTHAFFQFPECGNPQKTQLELIYSEHFSAAKKSTNTGYWKIGITLADVDIAAQRLTNARISVSDPKQFRDIGYLCHLQDPTGNSIELLQHWFEKNKPETAIDQRYPLGSRPGFGQITLRVKDPMVSCAFYQEYLFAIAIETKGRATWLYAVLSGLL